MAETVPPRWVTQAWQLHESAPERDGLHIGRIVQAGIEIADAKGLDGLSLRKLGEHLGKGTMAAYRHVDSKESLIHLMVDTAFGAPPEGIGTQPDWRAGVGVWAKTMIDRYHQHPWLLDAPLVGVSATPNRLLWLDGILRTLAKTGLGIQDLLDAALLVDGHVRHVAYLQREMEAGATPGAGQGQGWLPGLLASDEFAMVREVFADGLLEDGASQEWVLGLDLILAGIEAKCAKRGKDSALKSRLD